MSAENANICEKIGCNGACCRFNRFEATRQEVESKLGHAVEVDSLDKLQNKIGGEPGTYFYAYYNHGSSLNVAVVLNEGDCSYLDKSGNCSDYEGRFEHCKRLKMGGRSCSDFVSVEGININLEDIA
jgi:hypothetical protein